MLQLAYMRMPSMGYAHVCTRMGFAQKPRMHARRRRAPNPGSHRNRKRTHLGVSALVGADGHQQRINAVALAQALLVGLVALGVACCRRLVGSIGWFDWLVRSVADQGACACKDTTPMQTVEPPRAPPPRACRRTCSKIASSSDAYRRLPSLPRRRTRASSHFSRAVRSNTSSATEGVIWCRGGGGWGGGCGVRGSWLAIGGRWCMASSTQHDPEQHTAQHSTEQLTRPPSAAPRTSDMCSTVASALLTPVASSSLVSSNRESACHACCGGLRLGWGWEWVVWIPADTDTDSDRLLLLPLPPLTWNSSSSPLFSSSAATSALPSSRLSSTASGVHACVRGRRDQGQAVDKAIDRACSQLHSLAMHPVPLSAAKPQLNSNAHPRPSPTPTHARRHACMHAQRTCIRDLLQQVHHLDSQVSVLVAEQSQEGGQRRAVDQNRVELWGARHLRSVGRVGWGWVGRFELVLSGY